MITPFKPEKEDKIGFKLQLFGYIIADISLFYIFLYKPFDNGSRFMFWFYFKNPKIMLKN